jgi:Flp pilus assembly protein TadD
MKSLEAPDSHYLSAALGWIELGNRCEARVELGQIRSEARHHPAVLEVSWLLCAGDQDWPSALQVARTLVEVQPDSPNGWLHQAYALRRVGDGGLESAWQALRPAADRFPEEPTIAYNLSCYACQMGDLDRAREWLHRAGGAGGKGEIRLMALMDPDLKPLWDEIREW